MPVDLLIRSVPDELVQRMKERAARRLVPEGARRHALSAAVSERLQQEPVAQ